MTASLLSVVEKTVIFRYMYVMKELMKMNPLLVNVYNFTWTKTGLHNFREL